MKEHSLVTEERECSIDWYDVTFCTICEAHESPWGKGRFFYPGAGLELPADCDEAKKMVDVHKEQNNKAINDSIDHWHTVNNEHTKVPLHQFLGMSWEEYARFVETGQPDHQRTFSFNKETAEKYLYECNHKCPNCCVEDKD